MDDNLIVHYGILGMKWGIRRYQNKDGSLTAAGKKRLEKLDKEREALTSGTKSSSSSSSTQTKNISDMSLDELRSTVQRMQLEKAYRELSPKRVSKGRAFINKVAKDVVAPVLTEFAKNTLKTELDSLFKKTKTSQTDTKKKEKKDKKEENKQEQKEEK